MAWADICVALNDDVLKSFGEAATLPSGDVEAVFWPRGLSADGLVGSSVGLTGRVDRQDNPMIQLAAADAAGLALGDAVSVRGVSYRVSAPPREDDGGMVTVELMPADASGVDQFARWR